MLARLRKVMLEWKNKYGVKEASQRMLRHLMPHSPDWVRDLTTKEKAA